jgi:tetratricopeptide (TPR) repeat protein
MVVAWRSGGQQGVSRMGTMALGGLFLHTPTPPSTGSVLELLFEIATGAQVRARAVVRNCMPGKGMGVKFVHMNNDDRSRLNRFLKLQIEAGNIQEAWVAENERRCPKKVLTEMQATAPDAAELMPAETPCYALMVITKAAAEAPRHTSTRGPGGSSLREKLAAGRGQPRASDDVTDENLSDFVTLCEKSNHYQLLGIPSNAGVEQIKKAFYRLARKFHPDRHVSKPEWTRRLQQLMGAITEAYNVLCDERRRGLYDRSLMAGQSRTEAEESIDECLKLAWICQREENFAGAIVWLRKCIRLEPNVARYRVTLAANMSCIPHLRKEAIEEYQLAITLDPWNKTAYLQLGDLFEKLQLPWRAAPLYTKVLTMDPDHVVARQRLARIEVATKRKGEPRVAQLFGKKS